jgi:hypothetical protein
VIERSGLAYAAKRAAVHVQLADDIRETRAVGNAPRRHRDSLDRRVASGIGSLVADATKRELRIDV